MALLGSLDQPLARATCAFCRYRDHYSRCDPSKSEIPSFTDGDPASAQALVDYFDSWYPGVNGILHRAFVRRETKIRHAMAAIRCHLGCTSRRGVWLRRHLGLLLFIAFVALLPMVLSPTHPIAVYAFLAEYYLPISGAATRQAKEDELRSFLLSEPQLARYRCDLKEDVWAVNTGKLFVIVRNNEGELEQRSVRTWNEFLPTCLPNFLLERLDRKEISFLGDVVDAYLHSERIEAMGHYHSFGGPPSAGDQLAGRITQLPEIVVSNGIYPMVYVKGRILDFGPVCADRKISDMVARLDEPLQSGVEPADGIPRAATDTTMSFLSYLHARRDVDIDSLDEVRGEIVEMCLDFASDYRGLYAKDILAYEDENPDIYQLLHSVEVLTDWASYGLLREVWTVEDCANSRFTGAELATLH